MKYVPHDYQAYCIQRVVEDPAVGLFLRPGLGKTVITLSAVNILKYFRWQVQKVLVPGRFSGQPQPAAGKQ